MEQDKTKKKKISKKNILYLSVGIALILSILAGIYFFQQSPESSETDIFAEVNGEIISESKVQEIQESMSSQGQQINEQQAVEQAINMELLKQEAESEGYSATKQDVENTLETQLAQQNMSTEQLKQQVEMQGMNYNDFIEQYKEQLVIQEYLENQIESSEISYEEAREFYDNNQEMMGENVPPFEEVKEQIKMLIQQQEQQKITQDLIQDLRNNAEIEYHKEFNDSGQNPQIQIQE